MRVWEYKMVMRGKMSLVEANYLGEQGWELIAIEAYTFWFKREKH